MKPKTENENTEEREEHDRFVQLGTLLDAARDCDRGIRLIQNGASILMSRLPDHRKGIRNELEFHAINVLKGTAAQPLESFERVLRRKVGDAPLNDEAPKRRPRPTQSLLDAVTPL